MRIALCDWDEKFIQKIKNMIYLYAELIKIDIVVDCYTSGEKLIKSKTDYNIIFLEYHLKGIDGLKTAEKIRKSNSNTSIIFVSECTDFVFEAFKVNPYRFLIKPINQNTLFETLNDYFKKYGYDYHVLLKIGDDNLCLDTSDIYFIEANNKNCYVNLESKALKCNKTMAWVYNKLPKSHFIKINRAFIVNINFVKKYNNEEIFLSNNKSLHITRKYLKPFKEEYKRFICPKEI